MRKKNDTRENLTLYIDFCVKVKEVIGVLKSDAQHKLSRCALCVDSCEGKPCSRQHQGKRRKASTSLAQTSLPRVPLKLQMHGQKSVSVLDILNYSANG